MSVVMANAVMLIVIMQSVPFLCYSDFYYAECPIFIVILTVIMQCHILLLFY
jgi:hypothetical protein